MRKYLPFLLAAALTLGVTVGSPALAGGNVDTVEVRVSSKGLDLTTEVGAEQFLRRLARAATLACGETPDPSPLVRHAGYRFQLCRITALADAVGASRSRLLKRQFAALLDAHDLRMADQ